MDAKQARSILVFLKSPEKGKVKTRLAAAAGEDFALNFYKHCVSSILKTLNIIGCPVAICCHPPDSVPEIIRWLGNDYRFLPQCGNDLGQRMANAFGQIFSQGSEQAILIGTDIPDLPQEILQEAFESLEYQDAVIGPASDGGYYLIGFRKKGFLPDIFRNIVWSTARVFEDTMRIFREKNRTTHTLPIWHDIDTFDDLTGYEERCRKSGIINTKFFPVKQD